jgi:hypothetical protein
LVATSSAFTECRGPIWTLQGCNGERVSFRFAIDPFLSHHPHIDWLGSDLFASCLYIFCSVHRHLGCGMNTLRDCLRNTIANPLTQSPFQGESDASGATRSSSVRDGLNRYEQEEKIDRLAMALWLYISACRMLSHDPHLSRHQATAVQWNFGSLPFLPMTQSKTLVHIIGIRWICRLVDMAFHDSAGNHLK